MKKATTALFILFLCSINALGQTSIVSIGKAVTQCNDFAFAKNMLIGDGLTYDETQSNENYASFYNSKVQYADKALFVGVYKLSGSNKVEKCVITFYNINFLSDLKKVGYQYCNPNNLSIKPFQELYESDKYAMGLNRNKKGWLIATFFRYDQEVEFEHLNDSIIKKDAANKYEENDIDYQEHKVDLNKILSLGDNDPVDYNYTELGEEGIEYLDSLGIYWSDKLQSWVTKNIEMIEKLNNQESATNSKDSENIVYSIAETPPEFIGGNDALWEYISKKVKYPKTAKKYEIQGKVLVQFVVSEDGSVTDVKITRGVEKSLDEEAIRVISSMPKWNPGTINGTPVKVKYTLPIVFKL